MIKYLNALKGLNISPGPNQYHENMKGNILAPAPANSWARHAAETQRGAAAGGRVLTSGSTLTV